MQTMRNFSISNSPVLDVIRDNPLPLALAGIGLGWLALATLRGGGMVRDSAARRLAPSDEWAGYEAGKSGGGNGSGAETATAEAGDAALNPARVAGKMARWTDSVRDRAGDVASRGSEAFQDHPVAVGLLAAAAGLALGLALPRGRQRDDLLETAEAAGDDILRKTGKVIRQAAAAVGEGAAQTAQRAAETLRGESGATH